MMLNLIYVIETIDLSSLVKFLSKSLPSLTALFVFYYCSVCVLDVRHHQIGHMYSPSCDCFHSLSCSFCVINVLHLDGA